MIESSTETLLATNNFVIISSRSTKPCVITFYKLIFDRYDYFTKIAGVLVDCLLWFIFGTKLIIFSINGKSNDMKMMKLFFKANLFCHQRSICCMKKVVFKLVDSIS